LKVDNHRERYLTTKEIKKLYEKIEDDTVKLFIQLSLSTGGRLETILNIKVKDINLDDKNITLKDLKNDSTYKGFINEKLLLSLSSHITDLSANDFVVGGKNTKIPTRTISRKIKNIIDELFNDGLDKRDAKNRAVIHTLRHTFASHLAINGTPIFTIQKLMNHKDINMTLRYAKLAPDSGKEFVHSLYI
jgi:integrase